jgi:hypothetical protein
MFTRKNKGGEVNKKTRKYKDSQQKGGGDWLASTEFINNKRKGVPNIGNTCYLCALYQLLFSIEEFAILIMNYYIQHTNNKPKILEDKSITTLFKLFTNAVNAKEEGKQSKYDFTKSVFIQEITFKFGPVDISELLCYLLSQIFFHISGTDKTNKLTYEPVMIPMILFPGQNPYGRQQDPAEAIQELIKYIPQLGEIIGFSQTENKYYKSSSETTSLVDLNKEKEKFESNYLSKKFSGKQEHNDILKIKPDIGKDESLQELIFKIGESDVGSKFPLTDMDEAKKKQISLTGDDINNNQIAFYTKEDYSDMKDYVIIYFPRTYTDSQGANEKRNDNLIDPNETLLFEKIEYIRCGIICHLGDTGRYGHYVYEDESYSNNKKEFNDENPLKFMKSTTDKYQNNKKSDQQYAMKKAWSMLLYKKKEPNSLDKIDKKLIKMIDNDNWKFVFNNNIANMDLMLKTNLDLINSTYTDGGVKITALMRQAENGTQNVLQFLVEKGADVNQTDNSNPPRTALDYAISRKKVDNILYLLSVDKLNISKNTESLIEKIKSSKLKKEDEDIIVATIESKLTTDVNSEEEGKVEEGKLIDEKQTLFTSIIGNNYYKVPFFANYNNLVKDLMKVKSIKIGDKRIYYIKQCKPNMMISKKDNDIVFLPHLWNSWKDEFKIKPLTRKGELTLWKIGYTSKQVELIYSVTNDVLKRYNSDKEYVVHDGLMSGATPVPPAALSPDLIAISFKWTPNKDSDTNFDNNTFYGIYEFVDEDKISPEFFNIGELLSKGKSDVIEKIFVSLKEIPGNDQENELFRRYIIETNYKIDDETAIENIKLFAKPAFDIEVGELNAKTLIQNTSISEIDNIKGSLITAVNVAIESQPISASSNMEHSFEEAANTAIKSEESQKKSENELITSSDNVTDSLIKSANAAIESQPILTSDNVTDSLIKSANAEIDSQTKSEIELITSSSNIENSFKEAANKSMELKPSSPSSKAHQNINSVQTIQPTQSVKTYTIQFESNGNIKIVTEKAQTPGQSLSHEMEDQYFKGNHEKYIPSNEKTYTVTVTTDPTSNKTIIEI